LLFAWNFTRQPAFLDYVKECRIEWELINTDYIVSNTFWLWIFPWLTNEMLDYVVLKIKQFIDERK
jgi:CDP-6-deoxy-D-xylo-4-hexulose-3-dehydrase